MKSHQVRESFLQFFRQKGHTIVPSASLVPAEDPTLLFTNAGMNQFKDVFLGLGNRPYTRVADTQKVIRVSGKHNDLEEVGYDGHHHTFFEMLGNWSFGDYYKREAIQFAWELVTEVWQIPKEKIWVTVYLDDNEAEDLWGSVTDLPDGRVVRFDEKENFWEMGETGPCGPCSEMFVDLGPEADPDFTGDPRDGINVSDRFREFWNLVFIQYNRDQNGDLHPLPEKHVDTGMGFERITAILQGVNSNYKTDVFLPLLETISDVTGQPYFDDERGAPHRVIADHIRCLTFAIGDGVMPSNDGRGYVIRRILRRAILYGKRLGMDTSFIFNFIDPVIEQLGTAFPDVIPRRELIQKIVQSEENRFHQTLDRGLDILNTSLDRIVANGDSTLDGERAFELYDTFGFPLDLTQILTREREIAVDEQGFNDKMEQQQERSRAAWRASGGKGQDDQILGEIFKEHGPTEFVGYHSDSATVEVVAIVRGQEIISKAIAGEEVQLLLNQTPFYGESGGQVSDLGTIEGQDVKLQVLDVQKPISDLIVHTCQVVEGSVTPQMVLTAQIDTERRQQTAISHTATHILHSALREVLGTHVGQAGSLVEPGRLRFDFSHYEGVSSDQLQQIETSVNDKIRQNDVVQTKVMPIQEAKDQGALAFFGDKYSDIVRMVQTGDYSTELCGGTHLQITGAIGLFKVIGESSVAAGTRRIEALTGATAVQQQQMDSALLQQMSNLLKTQRSQIPDRLKKLLRDNHQLERELADFKTQLSTTQTTDLTQHSVEVKGINVVAQFVENLDRNGLRNLTDDLKNRLGSGIVVLGTGTEDNVSLIVGVTSDLTPGIQAGNLMKVIATSAGGRGGGRPELAQGGTSDLKQAKSAVSKAPQLIEDLI